MNNIFLNNDPLLYGTNNQQPNNINDYYAEMYKQRALQQEMNQPHFIDYIGDLDKQIKELEPNVIQSLSQNSEYNELSQTLQNTIQQEIIFLVKSKLNTNQQVIENIKKQVEIIKKVKQNVKENEQKNFSELNDYIKNYSHLTFDEYKKIKNQENESR